MATTKIYKTKSVRISMQDDPNVLNSSPKYFTIPTASCNIKATEGSTTIDCHDIIEGICTFYLPCVFIKLVLFFSHNCAISERQNV